MFATLSAILIFTGQHPKAPDADATAVRAMYPAFGRAVEAKNWAAVSRLLAPGFVEDTPTHQKIGKAAFLSAHARAFRPLNKVKMSSQIMEVNTAKGRADVELRWEMTAEMHDKKGKHSVLAQGSEAHSWRKSHGKWQLGYIREHETTFAVDGHVSQPKPAHGGS